MRTSRRLIKTGWILATVGAAAAAVGLAISAIDYLILERTDQEPGQAPLVSQILMYAGLVLAVVGVGMAIASTIAGRLISKD